VTVYAKSDTENISEQELEYHLETIIFELKKKNKFPQTLKNA